MKLSEIKELWAVVPADEHINIYINTPFCYCQCRYCLYQGNKYNKERVDNYFKYYLLPNLESVIDIIKNREIDTVYFGGGTPNCMPIKWLKKIVEKLGPLFYSAKARIIELNPSFLTDEYIDAVGKLNFTLVTLGIQTFNIASLIKMRRTPVTFQRIQEITNKLKQSGIKYVSFDLIAFVQNYSKLDLKNYLLNDIEKAISTDADFITIYPELNLINIDHDANEYFRTFIKERDYENYYRESDDFSSNPRSIVRLIKNEYSYDKFLKEILPYYENDFPYASMNIIGIGDYHSKQEVISYSPDRFAYIEEYSLSGPRYRLLYNRKAEGENTI